MASLGKVFRRNAFPCTTEGLELPTPSQRTIHHAAFDEPVAGPLDAKGLKRRINWSNKLQLYRNISPRFQVVVRQLKENCENLIHMGNSGRGSWKRPFVEEERKSLENDIVALDAGLQSRWDHEESPKGLCQMVEDAIEAMMEIRMAVEYGDYISLHCEVLNQGENSDSLWKRTQGCDWQDVAQKICDEERELKLAQRSQASDPETPWLDDVHTAAMRKNLNFEQTVFEIKSYAERNAHSHSGIGRFIERCEWETLAKRIAYDKSTLPKVFKNRQDEGIRMRIAIGKCEHEWYDYIYDDGAQVVWQPSEKASKKSKALMKRMKDKAEKLGAARKD